MLALAIGAPGYARNLDLPERDARGDETVDYWSRYARAELALERSLFRGGDDIAVRFRVSNTGVRALRIYPQDGPNRTWQLMVTDRQGRELPLEFNAASYARREHGNQRIEDLYGSPVREVILQPGETLERMLYLNDFFRLSPGGEYRLIGYFYPDARNEFVVRSSVTLSLRIRSAQSAAHGAAPGRFQAPDGSAQQMGLSAEETVYLFLSAEMQRNWENYLKYVELSRYITSYDRFSSRFARAQEAERPSILEEFAAYLCGDPADRLRRFRILSAEPERDEDGATMMDGRMFVRASALREAEGYSAQYEYTYTLERARGGEAGFWKIVQVEARLIR